MNDLQTAPVLRVEGLHVYYGNFHAVQDVSFEVKPGEIFGFLGPNGAGKTSTLSAVEGLLKPKSGTISVAGLAEHNGSLYYMYWSVICLFCYTCTILPVFSKSSLCVLYVFSLLYPCSGRFC